MEGKETLVRVESPKTRTENKRVNRENSMTEFSQKNHQTAHSSTADIKNYYSLDDRQRPDVSSDSDEGNDNQSKETSCQSENPKMKRKLSSESNNSDEGNAEGGGEDDLNASDQSAQKRRKLSQDIKENKTSDENAATENNPQPPVMFASIVAAFYNSVDQEFEERKSSRIFYLRNFNNWVKTNLIDDCMDLLQGNQYCTNLKVLDMCCGKGGDIIKWLKVNARYLVMTDIADVSLEKCKERFVQMREKFARKSDVEQEVILADCTRDRLKLKYKDPSIKFDIVSCQFSFHYCFESLPQAECMLQNVAECLKPGGFFIGTLPNANEIVKRLILCRSNRFGNDIFSLKMITEKPYPLFGAKYLFKLEGVVDCPEFLVHFPTFERLAGKFGLKLVIKCPFDEMYQRKKNTEKGFKLLRRMKALETYPPSESLNGALEEYVHATVAWEKKNSGGFKLGTLSKSEWEAITLYDTFIFQKRKS